MKSNQGKQANQFNGISIKVYHMLESFKFTEVPKNLSTLCKRLEQAFDGKLPAKWCLQYYYKKGKQAFITTDNEYQTLLTSNRNNPRSIKLNIVEQEKSNLNPPDLTKKVSQDYQVVDKLDDFVVVEDDENPKTIFEERKKDIENLVLDFIQNYNDLTEEKKKEINLLLKGVPQEAINILKPSKKKNHKMDPAVYEMATSLKQIFPTAQKSYLVNFCNTRLNKTLDELVEDYLALHK